jgi:hypothetical protein
MGINAQADMLLTTRWCSDWSILSLDDINDTQIDIEMPELKILIMDAKVL